MTYCISDIHGCYDEFLQLLAAVGFTDEDTLYVLGDVVDRGARSMDCMQYIMSKQNIHLLMGNHEQMMLDFLLSPQDADLLKHWGYNGGIQTLKEFLKLSKDTQEAIAEYLINLQYFYRVTVSGQKYLLVHAGVDVGRVTSGRNTVSTETVLNAQYIEDLLWIRDKFIRRKALPTSITVFGHTPMLKKSYKGKIWRDKRFNDKIGIDGGCVFGGKLHALRLDDQAEFSVSKGTA